MPSYLKKKHPKEVEELARHEDEFKQKPREKLSNFSIKEVEEEMNTDAVNRLVTNSDLATKIQDFKDKSKKRKK